MGAKISKIPKWSEMGHRISSEVVFYFTRVNNLFPGVQIFGHGLSSKTIFDRVLVVKEIKFFRSK